jgi:hypothetical protein
VTQSIVNAVKTGINVIIINGGENFFLHLLRKTETTAAVFEIDIIDKFIIIKHEFLINLVSAVKAFIYVLLNDIFNIILFNSDGEIRVYLNYSSVIGADLVKKKRKYFYISSSTFLFEGVVN